MVNPFEPPQEPTPTRSRRTLYAGVGLILAAGVIPMLAMVGTVFGMVVSFNAVANSDSANPSAVAEGISIARWTTVGGMAIAVVAAMLGIFLVQRSRRPE